MMPYVNKFAKELLDTGYPPQTPGELTYVIYRTCLNYFDKGKFNFIAIATVMGCLVCAMLELYRRKVAPYEQEKIKENGDVL